MRGAVKARNHYLHYVLTRVFAADRRLVAEVGHHAASAAGRVQHDREAVDRGTEAVVVIPLLWFVWFTKFMYLVHEGTGRNDRREPGGRQHGTETEIERGGGQVGRGGLKSGEWETNEIERQQYCCSDRDVSKFKSETENYLA